jgi:hypothetical protein
MTPNVVAEVLQLLQLALNVLFLETGRPQAIKLAFRLLQPGQERLLAAVEFTAVFLKLIAKLKSITNISIVYVQIA